MRAVLDHLVVAAATLEQGEDYIESRLGARPLRGGKHVAMGTHNSLLRLGEKTYLEVIAVDPDGKPSVHVHAVLGRRDGGALAGHLLEARVRPTLEIIVTESPAHLCKVKDRESGLALIKL